MSIKITEPKKVSDITIRFKCPHCGSIFETDIVSTRHIWIRPELFANCPICHRLCCSAGNRR